MDACPERDLLRTMLVDENRQEELETHLAGCARCAREAEAIMDEEISCLRREFQPEEGPSRPETLGDLKRKIRERGVRDDGAAEEATAPPDRIGPYEILEPLGKGGMGTVYKARQPNTGRIVALKVIHKDLMSARLVRRFQHEAEILAELEHTGIATVYDAGSWHREDGDVPYLVMELVEGSRITEYVESPALTLHQRLALIASVCDAVGYAHQHGFIHRDLKPSNILVNHEGQPKVVDFGVAHDTRCAGRGGDGHGTVHADRRDRR